MDSSGSPWRRLAWPAIFLAVGAAMLVLSALGTFRSREMVPWVFGGIWALAGLVEVVLRRRKGRPATLLLVAGVACALLAPLGQVSFYRVDARRTEHAADPVRMVGATALYNGPPEEELARLERFLADRGVIYPSLVSADGALQKAFHVRTLPTTILLDDGRVVAYRIGIRGARAVLEDAERRLGEG